MTWSGQRPDRLQANTNAKLRVRPLTVRRPSPPRGVARGHGSHRISRATEELRVLVLIGIVIVLTAIGGVGLYTVRRRRTPYDLPNDWWAEFERDFRAYARSVTPRRPSGPGRQRDGGPRGR
jgi:hypothetical protein